MSFLRCCLILTALAFSAITKCYSAEQTVRDTIELYTLGNSADILVDTKDALTLDQVRSEAWKDAFIIQDGTPRTWGFNPSTFWLRTTLTYRGLGSSRWMLEFPYAPLQYVDLYMVDDDGVMLEQHSGSAIPYVKRPFSYHSSVFPITLHPGKKVTLYIRVAGESSKNLQHRLRSADAFARHASVERWTLGIYFGVIFGLMTYNIFIFMTVREKVYLWYVAFLATFTGFSLCTTGLISQYLDWNLPNMTTRSIPLSMALSGLTSAWFAVHFLHINLVTKSFNRLLITVIVALSLLTLIMTGFAGYLAAVISGTVLALVSSISYVFMGAAGVRRGLQPARYYLSAWICLLVSIIVDVLRVAGILPSNFVTDYSLLFGSTAEAVVLSLALASRMRKMKEEKDSLQDVLLRHLQTHSQHLETEVQSRTAELMKTQQELVMKEKLASLGVLTAGVAHEINNPNNFVHVGLQNTYAWRDGFEDFISELLEGDDDPEIRKAFSERFRKLDQQLSVIDEGTRRISQIVSGLQAVTHLNEAEQQDAEIIAGLESTLQLLEPKLKESIEFILDLKARPKIPCWPAELNQVFMSVLINACQAIQQRAQTEKDLQGLVILESATDENSLIVSIEDNGCGMSEYVRTRMFDPFFTTKPVGTGSGLGLSSARDIVRKHGGSIDALSFEGQGTTMRIVLPLTSQASPA